MTEKSKADIDYSNGDFIPDGESYPARWAAAAASFRAGASGTLGLRYGPSARQVYDLFVPDRPAQGTVIFIHGGYWLAGDGSVWSHLAAGPLARGWAVAVATYDLCPDVALPQITTQIATLVGVVTKARPGPIVLTGHSAGGHLVARMVDPKVLPDPDKRIARIIPISPLSDLVPLMDTAMKGPLGLDEVNAPAESPRRQPAPSCPVTVWVGADERPVFLDQARWLGEAWRCPVVVEPARHHFDVIAGLSDPDHPLTGAVTEGTVPRKWRADLLT